eukprot:UN05407
MAEYGAEFQNGEAPPTIEQETKGLFSFISMPWPTSPTAFLEMYGWYLLAAFLFYYFLWDSIKQKILSSYPTSNNNVTQIPPKNDLCLHEMRAKQQQRLDKITKIHQEKGENKDEKSSVKLSKKHQQMKNSAAYRYATTGKWGKGDEGGSGGMADAQVLPRYRPPSAFQRHGRRPGAAGGGGG